MRATEYLPSLRHMALPTALVVEDDTAVREVLVHMLRRCGFRTVEAADGRGAIAELNMMETVDLVLSDIVMPGGIRGDELAVLARKLRPSARVLLMTGYRQGTTAVDAAVRSGERLLYKPIGHTQLWHAVAKTFETPAME